jgi:hypothetical protein
MSKRIHNVFIYQNPRQGASFISQHVAGGYRHSKMAKGGDDTASFVLHFTPSQAEVAFEQLLGCVVRVYVDNTEDPIWEGYIDRMTWRPGGITVTRGLENMSNRVNVTFYNADSAAANKVENTTHYDMTESIAVYGLKEGVYDAGVHFNNADKTHKVYLRNLLRNIYGWPQVSAVSASGGDGVIEIECKGLQYYAWDWQDYNAPKGSAADVTLDLVTAFLRVAGDSVFAGGVYLPANAPYVYAVGALAGGADWLKFVKVGAAPANISLVSAGGQTYLQFIQGLVEAGDGTNRFVFGITYRQPGNNQRYIYYNYANTAVVYTTYALSDAGRLRDVYGQVIDPWRVKPDAGIRINDILIGWSAEGDDPRIGYVERIEYDADAGSVSWQTGDDITLEGAMQRMKRYKKFKANDPFAAKPRQAI